MFFDLLNIKPPDWYQTFIDGRRLTSKSRLSYPNRLYVYLPSCNSVYRRNPKEKKETKVTKEQDTAQKQQSTLKVTDQYIALLIRVFVAAGLLDVSEQRVPHNPRTSSNEKMLIGAHIDVRGKHQRHEPFSEGDLAHG